MTSEQAQKMENLNFRVLRFLQEKPDLSQRELADRLGISLGKMNYCSNALIDKVLVKLENFQNSQHKLKYVYLLIPSGISDKVSLTSCFLKRKVMEYEQLKAEINAPIRTIPADIPEFYSFKFE